MTRTAISTRLDEGRASGLGSDESTSTYEPTTARNDDGNQEREGRRIEDHHDGWRGGLAVNCGEVSESGARREGRKNDELRQPRQGQHRQGRHGDHGKGENETKTTLRQGLDSLGGILAGRRLRNPKGDTAASNGD